MATEQEILESREAPQSCLRLLSGWGSERSPNSPSEFVDPASDASLTNSSPFSPDDKRKRFAVIQNDSICSLISHLLLCCCPSAIFQAVIPVVVYSINARPLWARTHIGRESLEAFSPLIAHSDAPSSVVGVTDRVLVLAPTNNFTPQDVKRMRRGIDSVHNNLLLLALKLVSETSARFGQSYPKRPSLNAAFRSTFTSAKNMKPATRPISLPDNFPTIENVSYSNLVIFHVGGIMREVRHLIKDYLGTINLKSLRA